MNAKQLIEKTILARCNAENYDVRIAKQAVAQALTAYDKNAFQKPSKLIDEAVIRVKSLSKKGKR
jgi:hypothetical protein